MKAIGRGLYADGLYTITIVTARQFDDMLKAAADGDRDARRICLAFTAWSKQAEAAAKGGNLYPACFNCEAVLTSFNQGGHGIGGIAVVSPKENKGNAMVAAFCPECEALGKQHLIFSLKQAIENETGLTSGAMH